MSTAETPDDGGRPVDWAGWLRRWDAQQEGYVPEREERFSAMFDVLDELLPPSFTALDLASGPGSISERLLARFPEARVIAVDIDPVMVSIGRGALGTMGGRLRWVETDLAEPGWLAKTLGGERVDAVLSTTALHWLEPESLTRVYGDLAATLPPGGVILNGDNMAYGPATPTLARLGQRALDVKWTDDAFTARGVETAEEWWASLKSDPAFAPLLAEQTRRFAGKQRPESSPGYDFHVAALEEAGFREVDTIWQILTDRILLAVR